MRSVIYWVEIRKCDWIWKNAQMLEFMWKICRLSSQNQLKKLSTSCPLARQIEQLGQSVHTFWQFKFYSASRWFFLSVEQVYQPGDVDPRWSDWVLQTNEHEWAQQPITCHIYDNHRMQWTRSGWAKSYQVVLFFQRTTWCKCFFSNCLCKSSFW